MSYSTGEIAELCGVTVRTVQYYDSEGLLKPDAFSEGGRRVYGEGSLKTLQIICMYKDLGLSLSDIKKILSDGDDKTILLNVLSDTEQSLESDIKKNVARLDEIKVIKQYLAAGEAFDRNTFIDVRKIMKGKRKLKATYAGMIAAGVVADAAEIAFAVLWAVKGLWLPFAVGMPVVVALLIATVIVAYKNLAYVCADCGKKFRPEFAQWFFAAHTPRTRKLTCPHCGAKKYHTETYSD